MKKMKWSIVVGAAIVGILLGQLAGQFFRGTGQTTEKKGRSERSPSSVSRERYSSATSFTGPDKVYQKVESFSELSAQLSAEKRSPLRTHTLLRSRLESLSSEEVQELLREGEIQTREEVMSSARYLMDIDPEAAYLILAETRINFKSMENHILFFKTMYEVGVQRDPLAILNVLEGMKRGGNQMANSLRFSEAWISHDPEAAMKRYDDLLRLRNVPMNLDQSRGERVFAGKLIKSWKKKDAEGLGDFIQAMPDGQRKELFITEFTK